MDVIGILVGAIVGAIPSYWLGHYFGKRSKDDLIRALKAQTAEITGKATITNFERLLRTEKWRQEYVDDCPTWICERNVAYQFVCGPSERPFHEPWTKIFPNQAISLFSVHLKINNSTAKVLPFISADEGRYTLPLPEQIVDKDGNATYYWNPDSIESLVAGVIGNFYRCKSLAEVAEFVKVGLHRVRANA